MKNCLTCKSCPSALLKVGVKLSEANNDFCKSGVYMRYKRPENESDNEFGYLNQCKKYQENIK